MKKFFALLLTLCLLCTAAAALADEAAEGIPSFDDMPMSVDPDETGATVEDFYGDWIIDVAFVGIEFIPMQDLLDKYFEGRNVIFTIGEGKIIFNMEAGEGFENIELDSTYESGQLRAKTEGGADIVVDLLEDGNLCMAVFLPDDNKTNLNLFLVLDEEDG